VKETSNNSQMHLYTKMSEKNSIINSQRGMQSSWRIHE